MPYVCDFKTFIFIYWREDIHTDTYIHGVGEEEREREMWQMIEKEHLSAVSPPGFWQQLGLGQAEAMSWELNPALPRG